MILFPYSSFVIETDLTMKESMQLLIESVQHEKTKFAANSLPFFKGKLEGKSFKIHRIIKYRNSFLPTIRGQIVETKNGTEIGIRMTLNLFVTVFMIFWLGFTFHPVLMYLWGEEIEKFNVSVSLGMFIFGYLLATLGFAYEAHRAETELFRIFDRAERSRRFN